MRKYFEWKLSDLEKRMGEEMQNLLNENNDSDGVFADTINLSHSGRTPRVPGGNIKNGYSNLESPLPKKKKNVQVHESSIGVTGIEVKGHDYSTLRRSNTGPYGVEGDITNGMTPTEVPIIRNGPNQEGNYTENKEKKCLHVLGKNGSGNTNEDTLLLDSSNYKSKDLGLDYNVGLKTSPEFSGISAKKPQNNIKQQINIMASDLHKWKIHPTPEINRKALDTDTTDLALQSPPPELEHTQQQQDRCIHKKFSFGPMAPNPSLTQDPKQFSPRPRSTTPPIDPKDLIPENARPVTSDLVGSNEHIGQGSPVTPGQIDTPNLEPKLLSKSNSYPKEDAVIDPINGFEPNQDFSNQKIKADADSDSRRGSRSKTFPDLSVMPSSSDLGLSQQESDSFFGLQNDSKKPTDGLKAETNSFDGGSNK
jgi:hypothetical protein